MTVRLHVVLAHSVSSSCSVKVPNPPGDLGGNTQVSQDHYSGKGDQAQKHFRPMVASSGPWW